MTVTPGPSLIHRGTSWTSDPSECDVPDPDQAEQAQSGQKRRRRWDFEHLLGLHTGTRRDLLPLVDIDPFVARALGADVRQVLPSAETIRRQLVHHRALPISVCRALAPCLLHGAYRQDGPRSAVVLFTEQAEPGRHFRAYVKATQAGHEIDLTSFLTMRDRDTRRELRKPYPIKPYPIKPYPIIRPAL